MNQKFAFLVAGTHSGCGKTTISLAIMAALKGRGFHVHPFKVGPDFIDPGFHTQISGTQSRNLDGWMLDPSYNRSLFERLLAAGEVGVVEGVMGLFDGYDGITESGSSAEMAKWLGIPVVLVVDARSMARSAAALVKGFNEFDPAVNLAGVIFNRIGGEGHLSYLKEAMSANVPEVAVLGGVPREEFVRIPERHLGLVTSDEILLDPQWKQKLVDMVERYIDIDLILKRAAHRDVLSLGPKKDLPLHSPPPAPVPIAVARDAAFCFYYQDNFDLLRQAGADLLFFSPLAGESIPKGASGLYLGGGYPELYGEALSANANFVEDIRRSALQGMPVYAECGGLMTLSRFIESIDGARYPMAGLLPFGTRMLPKRKALGYTEVVLQRPCIMGDAGLHIRGHEFHYSEIIEMEEDPSLFFAYELVKRKYEARRSEGYMKGSVLASYVHLHWGSAPGAPEAFVGHCRRYLSEMVIS